MPSARAHASRDSARLVELAARLMHEDALEDPAKALRRAAKQLGQSPSRWPDADEVRSALKARLQLFEPDHAQPLRAQRVAALEALGFFKDFSARLTGAVADGSAFPSSTIELELQAEHADDVLHFLLDKRIPIDQTAPAGRSVVQFEFIAGAFNYRLSVITPDLLSRRSALGIEAAQLSRLLGSS